MVNEGVLIIYLEILGRTIKYEDFSLKCYQDS